MPHLVIECSEHVLTLQPPGRILREVHDAAEATGLFGPGDVKVRIHPFTHFTVGTSRNDFIHVFAGIMQDRTDGQQQDLSERVVRALMRLFPDVPVISMNVDDFQRAGYCNRTML